MSQDAAILAAITREEVQEIDRLLWPIMFGTEKEVEEPSALDSTMLNREEADKIDQITVATTLGGEELHAASRAYSIVQEGQRVRRDVNIARASRKDLWFSQLGIMFKRKRQLEAKLTKEKK
jgi:hypothetical protein